MTDLMLPDRDEREAIASDLDTTFLVEAAAGTGKTTSLVTRMTALISQGKTAVPRMAAITFTRKAAAHLRQKFQNTLEKAHAEETDGTRKRLLAEALQQLDRCYIGTIHSFCAQLLRERPVEAGVDPEFSELEESENARLRDECWYEHTQRLFVEQSHVLQQMEDLGLEFNDLKATYDVLCQYLDVETASSTIPSRPDFSTCMDAANRLLDSVQGFIPDQPPSKGWDPLQGLILRALRLRRILDLGNDIEAARLLGALDGNCKATQNRWPDKDTAKRYEAEFSDLRDTHIRPTLRQWREYLHPQLMSAVQPAVDAFARHREEKGLLNFQDLLMLARNLLRDHPHIRTYFRDRFTHLLVDEFQDTDPIQAELMLYLTGDDPRETDWRQVRPVPGPLFVVGDPKQSIYRFRRADIATYNQVREIIERSGGRVLTLAANFRSVEGICRHVNTSFDPIFPPQATDQQAAGVHLHPVRGNTEPLSGVFRMEYSTSDIGSKYDAAKVNREYVVRADSDGIADWIRGALASGVEIEDDGRSRPVRPGDFMIVLRHRKRLSTYARALEVRGIPYEISGSGGFAESSEIRVLLPFLKAVVDPDDPVSLLAYLRGPLCGISDRSLYEFKRNGGRFSYTSKAPEGTDEGILRGFALLLEARESARELPPGSAVARICDRLGLLPYAAAQDFGDTRAGNLLKLLALIRSQSADGRPFGDIVAGVEELGSGSEIDEMSTEPGRPDAVRLMNLHRSKGLEAPIVFLACPLDGGDHDPEYYVDRSVDPPQGHFLITKQKGEFQREEVARPQDWDTKAAAEKRFQQAEEDRLLYVAATRPMNVLVVSAYNKDSGSNPGLQGPWVTLIDPTVEQLPPIPIPETQYDGAEIPDLTSGFAEARDQIKSRLAASSAASYAVTQVTKITHAEGSLPLGTAESGHGPAWGRILHGCLEALMIDSELDTRLLVENAMRQEDLVLDELEEIVGLVESVCASDLWKQASAAETRMVEVPFAIQVASSELGLDDGPETATLHGTIDLVFRDTEGWTIVDYKSDVVGDRLQSLIAFYSPQVRCYLRYWRQLTGQSTRAALFFTDTGHVEWLRDE